MQTESDHRSLNAVRLAAKISAAGLAALILIPTVIALGPPIWLGHKMAKPTQAAYRRSCHYIQDQQLHRRQKRMRKYESRPAAPQEMSMLVSRLPLELRQQVYDEFYQGRCVNIRVERNQLSAKVVARELHVVSGAHGNPLQYPNSTPERPMNLLALSFACRQLYQETIEHLYKHTCFHISDGENTSLAALRIVLPGHRIDAIRSLSIDYKHCKIETMSPFAFAPCGNMKRPRRTVDPLSWFAMCDDLAMMPRLERLHIRTWVIGSEMLAPLMRFTHLVDFVIEYDGRAWFESNDFSGLKNAPFQLKISGRHAVTPGPVRCSPECQASIHRQCDVMI